MPASPPRLTRPSMLSDMLLYRMNYLFSMGGGMATRLCEGRFGITRREWRLLALLAAKDGVRSSVLAEHAQLDRVRTSRAISALVAKRLVLRAPATREQPHAVLRLSEPGRQLYASLFPLIVDINRQLLDVLSKDEVAMLDDCLDRLQQRCEQMVKQADLPKTDRRRSRL